MLDDPRLLRMKNDLDSHRQHERKLVDKIRDLRNQKQTELDRLGQKFDHDIDRAERELDTARRQIDDGERAVKRREDELREKAT